MKKILILIITCLLLSTINTFALVSKSSDIYLTDEANILNYDSKKYIIEVSNYLKKKKKIDYYVVTINSLEDYELESYAEYIYKSFNISKKGLLILVSKNDRVIYIKAGEALSKIISNEMIEEYIEVFFMPYLEKGEWDKGIKNGYSAFLKYICDVYHIDSSNIVVYGENDFIQKYKVPLVFLIIWLCTIIGYVLSTYFIRFFDNKQ